MIHSIFAISDPNKGLFAEALQEVVFKEQPAGRKVDIQFSTSTETRGTGTLSRRRYSALVFSR